MRELRREHRLYALVTGGLIVFMALVTLYVKAQIH